MPNTPDATKDLIAAIEQLKTDVVNAVNAITIMKVFGNAYANNVTVAIVITVVDTFVKIASGMTPGALTNVNFQNNCEFEILQDGEYLVLAQVSATSAVVAEEIELCMQIDGVPVNVATAHTEVSIGVITRPSSLSINGIFDLNTGNILSLALANHSTTADLQVQHINFTIVKIN